MERIERELAEEFGFLELREDVEIEVFGGVEGPDRLARDAPQTGVPGVSCGGTGRGRP